jgi:hypothetical protein
LERLEWEAMGAQQSLVEATQAARAGNAPLMGFYAKQAAAQVQRVVEVSLQLRRAQLAAARDVSQHYRREGGAG